MPDKPNISHEMKKMEYEPLLPAEKKLIIYNLLIGSILLVLLIWVSHTFFPITNMEAKPEQAPGAQAKPVASSTGPGPGAPVSNAAPPAR